MSKETLALLTTLMDDGCMSFEEAMTAIAAAEAAEMAEAA